MDNEKTLYEDNELLVTLYPATMTVAIRRKSFKLGVTHYALVTYNDETLLSSGFNLEQWLSSRNQT